MSYGVFAQMYLDSFIKGDVSRIEDNCEAVHEILADAILKRTVPQFWDEMKAQAEKFEAISNLLKINEDMEKQKIYYYAALRTMIQLSQTVNEKVEEIKDFGQYKSFTHLFPILQMLYKSESLSHATIAKRLDISNQSLSNFFGRTNKFELWKHQKEGKSQFCSINFKGKQVYKEYLKHSLVNEQAVLDELIIYLLDAISRQMEVRNPDIDGIISGMNCRYGKHTAIFSSSAVKFKLKSIFVKKEIAYRKREENYRNKMEPLLEQDYGHCDMICALPDFVPAFYSEDADLEIYYVNW